MSNHLFIRIDHTPGQGGYKAVVVEGRDKSETRFATGDAAADYRAALAHADTVAANHRLHILISASVSNFVATVPGYAWTPDENLGEVIAAADTAHRVPALV